MKTKDRNASLDVVACYMLLAECISFEHIEDEEFILNNLECVEELYKYFSDDFRAEIEGFINTTILPIVDDPSYFDFLDKEEYGTRQEDGSFVLNSGQAIEMIYCEMRFHILFLNEKLLKLFSKYI